jgi:hypothetical protein
VCGVWSVAELFQYLDPAWDVFGHACCLVIEPRIAIYLAAGKHEGDRADQLVCQGHDGLLSTSYAVMCAVFGQ